MKIIFATWAEVEYQAVVLTHEGANDRLISYAFLRELPNGFIDRYVERGWGPSRKKKRK